MTNSQHTPGPWNVHFNVDDNQHAIRSSREEARGAIAKAIGK